MKQKIIHIVACIVSEIADEQGVAVPTDLEEDTPLFGQQGLLDSLGLVSLVVGVEQAIEDKFGISVTLADEKAMSQRNSPYRTIGSLAEYASYLIQTGS